MSDISESVIEEIRKLHGPDADDILSAMQQDEGEERRQKQREAEEYLINKAYEESLKEAKAKQTAVLTRAQISESVMGAVLDAAGGDRVQAAKLMEEFQRPSGRRDTQRTVDESTIIRKILEESEKAEIERRRRLAEEERKVAMAVRVAIEKSKEETQTKARQDRAAMEAELARMKKQLQEDADRLADEKAQLAARREAEVRAVKKREEELRAETARMEAEMARREEERRRRELDDAREERERERERERAKQKAKDEEAKERAARLAKEKAESERRQQQEHQRAREEAVAVAEATRKQEQKAREEALSRELQQREHQLKAREDRSPARGSPRVQDWISQSVLGPPKVSIYTQGGTALSVSEIKTFLMSVDPTLKEAEIFAHEFTHDYELANFIKEKCPHDTFPVVCIHGTPIGDLATLKLNRQHIPALLRGEMLELPSQQKKDVTTSLGVLDSALNVGEYVLSGVGSLLTLPVKILAWPFSSKATEPKPDAEEPEFQCIHQNWYYRNLVRVFRFREKGFVRVHPTHKDVRAEHEYSTIAVVTLTDAENMIINYNDGSAPDYIKASEADLKEMIRIIKTRSPKEIQVVVESS